MKKSTAGHCTSVFSTVAGSLHSRVAFPLHELLVLYRTTAGPECCAAGTLLMQMMQLNVQGVNMAGQSAAHSLTHRCQSCCF
jgi:hypothetical protein